MKWLRETFRLDKIVATGTTELAKVNALCTWVASRPNDRAACIRTITSSSPNSKSITLGS